MHQRHRQCDHGFTLWRPARECLVRIVNSTKLDDVLLGRVMNACCPRGVDEETVLLFTPTTRPTFHGLAYQRGVSMPGPTGEWVVPRVPHAWIYVPREPIFPGYP